MFPFMHEAGVSQHFYVDPRDKYDNRLNVPVLPTVVIAQLSAPKHAATAYAPSYINDVTSQYYRMYKCDYGAATIAGAYTVSVTYGGVAGPTGIINVVAAGADRGKSTVSTKIVDHAVGADKTLEVRIKHRFGNDRVRTNCPRTAPCPLCVQEPCSCGVTKSK